MQLLQSIDNRARSMRVSSDRAKSSAMEKDVLGKRGGWQKSKIGAGRRRRWWTRWRTVEDDNDDDDDDDYGDARAAVYTTVSSVPNQMMALRNSITGRRVEKGAYGDGGGGDFAAPGLGGACPDDTLAPASLLVSRRARNPSPTAAAAIHPRGITTATTPRLGRSRRLIPPPPPPPPR
ncbi:Uncharacterized protein FWK35_00007310 [Aphis craccivora]|uniref:Uncharacterized protein n=1 Tax=Aphis craccivora TaxID=307492 RepID=A0A6G0ZEG5_APHCR|nr:Uncharacterized protein FWK35_00007310 [Aphis craccivora]